MLLACVCVCVRFVVCVFVVGWFGLVRFWLVCFVCVWFVLVACLLFVCLFVCFFVCVFVCLCVCLFVCSVGLLVAWLIWALESAPVLTFWRRVRLGLHLCVRLPH